MVCLAAVSQRASILGSPSIALNDGALTMCGLRSSSWEREAGFCQMSNFVVCQFMAHDENIDLK